MVDGRSRDVKKNQVKGEGEDGSVRRGNLNQRRG